MLTCRIQRDVACRGRDIQGVIQQYTVFVKPAFDTFVAPSRKHADVIIPWVRCSFLICRLMRLLNYTMLACLTRFAAADVWKMCVKNLL